MFSGSDPSLRLDLVLADPALGNNEVDTSVRAQEFHTNIYPVMNTPLPSKDGQQGLVYDGGNGCIGNGTQLPPSSLPRIAFVRLESVVGSGNGSSNSTEGCTPAKAIGEITGRDSPNAILVTSPGKAPDPTESGMVNLGLATTLNIPVFWVNADTATAIQKMLQSSKEFNQNRASAPSSGTARWLKYPRVIMYPSEKFFPGVWEFTLIVVVVLLTLSFATSIAMHCHLYRVRRRQRLAWLQHQQNGGGGRNGAGRRRRTLLDKSVLESFPVITYTEMDQERARMEEEESQVKSKSEKEVEEGESARTSLDIHESAVRDEEAVDVQSVPVVDVQEEEAPLASSRPTTPKDEQPCSRPGTAASKPTSDHLVPPPPHSPRRTQSAPHVSATSLTSSQQDLVISTCAVCLDDFAPGDQLRQLPCGHRYHCDCIDPWLTEKSSLCPMCKTDFYVAPATEEASTEPTEDIGVEAEGEMTERRANRQSIRVDTGEVVQDVASTTAEAPEQPAIASDAAAAAVTPTNPEEERTRRAQTDRGGWSSSLRILFPFHALRGNTRPENDVEMGEMRSEHVEDDGRGIHTTGLFSRYVARRRAERRRDQTRRRRTGVFVGSDADDGFVRVSRESEGEAAVGMSRLNASRTELEVRERASSPARMDVQEQG